MLVVLPIVAGCLGGLFWMQMGLSGLQRETAVRVEEMKSQLAGLTQIINSRMDDRYRHSDAVRDFGTVNKRIDGIEGRLERRENRQQ